MVTWTLAIAVEAKRELFERLPFTVRRRTCVEHLDHIANDVRRFVVPSRQGQRRELSSRDGALHKESMLVSPEHANGRAVPIVFECNRVQKLFTVGLWNLEDGRCAGKANI